MDFAFVINDKYVNMMLVTMQSVIENNGGSHQVYIFTSGLMQGNIDKIHRIMKNRSCREKIIQVDDSCLDNVPILRQDFDKTPYYKLLIPMYIPDSVEKLLYLDADIIVNRSLNDLFNIDLGNRYFAAVPDYLRNKDYKYLEKLGIDKSKGERYFNSGLILFNMKLFKRQYKIESVLDYIRKNGHTFKYHDQEVLNGMFFRNYLQLPDSYNKFASYSSIGDIFRYMLSIKYRRALGGGCTLYTMQMQG